MLDTSEIVEVLTEIGYKLRPISGGYSCAAIFRNGDNPNALKINRDGTYKDFVTGEFGSLENLIAKTVGSNIPIKLKEFIKEKHLRIPFKKENLIKIPRILDNSELSLIKDNQDYVLSRNISLEVAEELRGGIVTEKRFKQRYVWPIFNCKEQLVGLTGRTLIDKTPKYYHYGEKNNWCYPLFFNLPDIKTKKEVIIVESPMDIMSLFTVGIRNCVCLFGVTINSALINVFLKINPKIIISTNNDTHLVGNNAAVSIQNRLLRYFDRRNVEIRLPVLKDFNEMLCQDKSGDSIRKWYNL